MTAVVRREPHPPWLSQWDLTSLWHFCLRLGLHLDGYHYRTQVEAFEPCTMLESASVGFQVLDEANGDIVEMCSTVLGNRQGLSFIRLFGPLSVWRPIRKESADNPQRAALLRFWETYKNRTTDSEWSGDLQEMAAVPRRQAAVAKWLGLEQRELALEAAKIDHNLNPSPTPSLLSEVLLGELGERFRADQIFGISRALAVTPFQARALVERDTSVEFPTMPLAELNDESNKLADRLRSISRRLPVVDSTSADLAAWANLDARDWVRVAVGILQGTLKAEARLAGRLGISSLLLDRAQLARFRSSWSDAQLEPARDVNYRLGLTMDVKAGLVACGIFHSVPLSAGSAWRTLSGRGADQFEASYVTPQTLAKGTTFSPEEVRSFLVKSDVPRLDTQNHRFRKVFVRDAAIEAMSGLHSISVV